MLGPGKYDEQAARALLDAKARGVVLVVFEGERGSGFSVKAPLELTLQLPRMLRQLADAIEIAGPF